mgnify:CR=1 FL=1
MDIKSTTGKLLKGDISGVVSDVKYQIERSLSLIGVIIVTVAASIGSGLFVLPSFAAAVMGPGICRGLAGSVGSGIAAGPGAPGVGGPPPPSAWGISCPPCRI